MSRLPRPMPVTSTTLRAMFPAWTFRYDGTVWRAEKRTGTAVRLICAHNVAELAVKLAAAEAGEAGRAQ